LLQALVLAGMLTMLVHLASAIDNKSSFVPFYITIQPAWYHILRDQRLVDDKK